MVQYDDGPGGRYLAGSWVKAPHQTTSPSTGLPAPGPAAFGPRAPAFLSTGLGRPHFGGKTFLFFPFSFSFPLFLLFTDQLMRLSRTTDDQQLGYKITSTRKLTIS